MRSGTVIGGFRVGRLIGRGSRGAVHEALQLSLERPVALRLLRPEDFVDAEDESRFLAQHRVAATIHHPGVVPTYEAGEWEGGRYVATRLIRGRTLAAALDAGEISSAHAASILARLEAALDAAHAAGLAHGSVSARNVLIDRSGAALLPDLGLGRPGTAAADRSALAELRALVETNAARRRRRRLLAPALAGLAGVAAVTAFLVASGSADQDVSAEPAPPLAAGTEPSGSDLAPGAAASIGCAAEPGPNTPACTLAQTSIAGRPTTVAADGAIRGWAVRNATGDLALQVAGFRDGRPFLRSFSQFESVPDRAPHSFATDLRVERGDVVGVTLAPGAAIGTREGGPGTVALRWEGTLPFAPQPMKPSRFGDELLLRVDVEPGGRPELPQLIGGAARAAPEGAALASQAAEAPNGRLYRVELVRVGDALSIDSSRGGRRIARAGVEGASAAGQLLSFDIQCGFRHGLCLRWQNQGGSDPLIHAYRLTPHGTFRQIG